MGDRGKMEHGALFMLSVSSQVARLIAGWEFLTEILRRAFPGDALAPLPTIVGWPSAIPSTPATSPFDITIRAGVSQCPG
jgi:hypothetical protein